MARKTEMHAEKRRGMTQNQRWVWGFILLFAAIFILLSVTGYYFHWADDQSAVRWGSIWSGDSAPVMNWGGKLGALTGDFLVARWFGLFGLAVPVALIILALRIMRFREVLLPKSIRITITIMILGSLSLGLLFGTRWGIFGTGLGGAHGILVAEWLRSFMGTFGTGLMLLLSWVLLAVYLNRSTIKVVNKVGQTIADNSARVGDTVGGKAAGLLRIGRGPREKSGEGQEVRVSPGKRLKEEPAAKAPVMKEEPEQVPLTVEAPAEPEPAFEITIPDQDPEPQAHAEEEGDIIAPWGGSSESVATPVAGREYTPGSFEVIDLGTPGAERGIVAGSVLTEEEVIEAGPREMMVEDMDDTLYDPTLELSKYQRPPVEILEDHSVDVVVTEEEVYENKNQIVRTLDNFGIKIQSIKATIGPTVTLYEIIPAPGIRISKIKNLEDDIALSLSALGIRIIAPMPGKGTIGIEVPNKDKKVVSMYSVVRSLKFQESVFDLPVVLGKTIQNENYIFDLAKMPHLLVAGATGQGKSVGLNAIITSLLYKKHPAELKFVLVDPKKVELTLYTKLERHFLAKLPGDDDAIITDTQKVIYTLKSLCEEMDRRYSLLRDAEVRHIKEYNDKFTRRRLSPYKGHRFLPYIVVIVDEFADMIMTAGREIETPIARIAQLARAVGIHLVIATQRPTTNIITGVIKANFPARIAFRVISVVDSRTILDQAGANQLIGRGDMLVLQNNELTRVQCAFIDTPEIERITEFIGNQRGYSHPYELPEVSGEEGGAAAGADLGQLDPMFREVARFIVQNGQGSTSAVQRRFSIGYNRAGRIMDQVEAAGIVGRAEGGKPREILISDMLSLEHIIDNYL